MQIVIDIPEKTVNEIKDNVMFAGTIPSEILWDVTSAIVNGTPLPKGHGRLIDADVLMKHFKEVMDWAMRKPKISKDIEYVLRTTAEIKSEIREAETIIEADKEGDAE